MNAKQIKTITRAKRELNFSLIPLERAERPSLWSQIKKNFAASPDLNLEAWERLEMKRSRGSFTSNQWRNY
ncbi:MAG: hypothetical protein JNM39_07570 [Bdellovibrionaceae bacterium]|nr:hypothetical protein [Pseudobdellovibrionaceae bacterium]